jgi:hypothetical protein
MIHHVSIPARDPQHVATVLAELLGGYAGPFIGPIQGAWVAYQEDAFGSGIEVYPETTTVVSGIPDNEAQVVHRDAPQSLAFHALMSVKVDRAAIERIGAREGWKTQHFWRGPQGMQLFELYEMWVENRILFELATEDMVAAYAKIANGPAQRQLIAARAAANAAGTREVSARRS